MRPGLRPRADEPSYPDDLDLRELPRAVRAELRGLPEHLATVVGSHLLMAGRLIEDEPERAYAHADAARRRAARLPVVRQMAGEAAYAAGEYAAALNEFRAVRRMTGTDELLALAADCERGLNRPQAALELVREGLGASPSAELFAELKLVQAGARADLGQTDEALRILSAELERPEESATTRARLAYAYADLVEQQGDEAAALEWFSVAARLDPEGETDAADRVEQLCGFVVSIDLDLLEEDSIRSPEDTDEPEDAPERTDTSPSEQDASDQGLANEAKVGSAEIEAADTDGLAVDDRATSDDADMTPANTVADEPVLEPERTDSDDGHGEARI